MTESEKSSRESTGRNQSRSKVKRLLAEYEMPELGDELVERWTRQEDRSSLRELSDYFNRKLLRAKLVEGESDPLDGEVENIYRILTGDETTRGARQQARSRLERRGIDVEALENDFVSYQAIRTYLRKYRDVNPPDDTPSPESHLESKRTTIQQLSSRLEKVTEAAVSELKKAGNLTIGEFDVIVTVRIHCRDCDTRISAIDLISQGGCQCDTP